MNDLLKSGLMATALIITLLLAAPSINADVSVSNDAEEKETLVADEPVAAIIKEEHNPL
ncbi:MAG: hypothetical protein HRT65_07905 [Flavobacteriaceae bacterium]|uniref:hypothetical protein n=1 Tax=Flagellimonas algarum TaxID=3230298 RepID=UPI0033922E1F|nr:hypothetical protein [Flavobacteriaceae bacterium]